MSRITIKFSSKGTGNGGKAPKKMSRAVRSGGRGGKNVVRRTRKA